MTDFWTEPDALVVHFSQQSDPQATPSSASTRAPTWFHGRLGAVIAPVALAFSPLTPAPLSLRYSNLSQGAGTSTEVRPFAWDLDAFRFAEERADPLVWEELIHLLDATAGEGLVIELGEA